MFISASLLFFFTFLSSVNGFNCAMPTSSSETWATANEILEPLRRQVLAFNEDRNDFDILNHFLSLTAQMNLLSKPFPCGLTLFAPNDAAVIRTVTDITGREPSSEFEAYQELFIILSRRFQNPIYMLSEILAYHMVDIAIPVVNFTSTFSMKTTQGQSLVYNTSTKELQDMNTGLPNSKVNLKQSEIWTLNGVIHLIDRILFPMHLIPDEDGNGKNNEIENEEPSPSSEVAVATAEYDSYPNESIQPSAEVSDRPTDETDGEISTYEVIYPRAGDALPMPPV